MMDRPTQRIDWYRVPVDAALLKELSASSDLQGLKQAGGHALLILALGVFTFWAWSIGDWYLWLPALLIYATVFNMLPAAVHELVHERVFKTPWLNRVFLWSFSFFSWWNPRWFLLSHNEHHKFTLHQPDDLEVVLPIHLKPRDLFPFMVFNWRWIFFTAKHVFRTARGIPEGSWEEHVLGNASENQRKEVSRFATCQLLGHGVILLVSAIKGWWILPFLTSFTPMYASWLGFLTAAPQHAGLVDQVNDFRLSCRTNYLNPFVEFLYWRMNYHIEHHTYPVVPCYNLPRLHEAMKVELPHTRNGLWETWSEISYILNRQKHDPDYQYRTPLPTDVKPVSGDAGAPGTDDDRTTLTHKVWECSLCGFIYDEEAGLPEEEIPPGTRWDDIPDDWSCPVCGVSKAQFEMIEISRDVASTKEKRSIEEFSDADANVG
jgi:fatty acid desaturase/rubredoxin